MGILNAGLCSGFKGIGFIFAMSIPNIARSMLDFGLQVETVLSQSLEAKAEKMLNQKVNTTKEIRFLSILILALLTVHFSMLSETDEKLY